MAYYNNKFKLIELKTHICNIYVTDENTFAIYTKITEFRRERAYEQGKVNIIGENPPLKCNFINNIKHHYESFHKDVLIPSEFEISDKEIKAVKNLKI